MATSAPTSAEYIVELAQYLEREAGRLDAARVDLRRDVQSTHGRWEGLVAERFRNHTGGKYRQKHIDLAHDRLREVASQLRQAAARQASSPVATVGAAELPSLGVVERATRPGTGAP